MFTYQAVLVCIMLCSQEQKNMMSTGRNATSDIQKQNFMDLKCNCNEIEQPPKFPARISCALQVVTCSLFVPSGRQRAPFNSSIFLLTIAHIGFNLPRLTAQRGAARCPSRGVFLAEKVGHTVHFKRSIFHLSHHAFCRQAERSGSEARQKALCSS